MLHPGQSPIWDKMQSLLAYRSVTKASRLGASLTLRTTCTIKSQSRDPPRRLAEDDYEFYLNGEVVRSRPFEPGNHISQLDLAALERRLTNNLANEPLRAFQDTSTPLESACGALELYVGRIHCASKGQSLKKRRKVFLRDAPGREALHWLLNGPEGATASLELGVRLATTISHCLAAEDKTQMLRDWSVAEQSARPGESQQ